MEPKRRQTPTVGKIYEKNMRNGSTHVLTVVKVLGKVKYQVGKQVFKSPSAAARAINGGRETNGWAFWKID